MLSLTMVEMVLAIQEPDGLLNVIRGKKVCSISKFKYLLRLDHHQLNQWFINWKQTFLSVYFKSLDTVRTCDDLRVPTTSVIQLKAHKNWLNLTRAWVDSRCKIKGQRSIEIIPYCFCLLQLNYFHQKK